MSWLKIMLLNSQYWGVFKRYVLFMEGPDNVSIIFISGDIK